MLDSLNQKCEAEAELARELAQLEEEQKERKERAEKEKQEHAATEQQSLIVPKPVPSVPSITQQSSIVPEPVPSVSGTSDRLVTTIDPLDEVLVPTTKAEPVQVILAPLTETEQDHQRAQSAHEAMGATFWGETHQTPAHPVLSPSLSSDEEGDKTYESRHDVTGEMDDAEENALLQYSGDGDVVIKDDKIEEEEKGEESNTVPVGMDEDL